MNRPVTRLCVTCKQPGATNYSLTCRACQLAGTSTEYRIREYDPPAALEPMTHDYRLQCLMCGRGDWVQIAYDDAETKKRAERRVLCGLGLCPHCGGQQWLEEDGGARQVAPGYKSDAFAVDALRGPMTDNRGQFGKRKKAS